MRILFHFFRLEPRKSFFYGRIFNDRVFLLQVWILLLSANLQLFPWVKCGGCADTAFILFSEIGILGMTLITNFRENYGENRDGMQLFDDAVSNKMREIFHEIKTNSKMAGASR